MTYKEDSYSIEQFNLNNFFEKLNSNNNFIIVTDENLKIVFMNKLTNRILSINGQRISEKNKITDIKDIIINEYANKIITAIKENSLPENKYCFSSNEDKGKTTVFKLKNSGLNLSSYYYCFLIDCTKELNYLRSKMEISEKIDEDIIESKNKTIITLFEDGKFRDIQDSFYKILGGEYHYYINKKFEDIMEDSYKKNFVGNFEKCKALNLDTAGECRLISFEGALIWVRYNLKCVEQLDGEIIFVQIEDISNKKALEYVGLKQYKILNTLYNKTTSPACIIDYGRLCIEKGNNKLCEILDETEISIQDKEFKKHYMLKNDIDFDKINVELQLNISVEIEEFRVSVKGKIKYLNIQLIPFKCNDILEKVLCLVKDITHKKKIFQLEKEKKQKEMEIMVFKEYEKIRTEFLANIAHEFKTPLNVIYSAVQAVEYYKKSFDKESLFNIDYSDIIKQNCYRLLRLVDNMVDMSLLEVGDMTVEYKKVDLVKEVEDIAMSINNFTKSKNISLVFDTNLEEFITFVDIIKLQRVLLNLLSNSIKFTKSFGEIKVSLLVDEKRGVYSITVKDNGIGISKENISLVLERFKQVDKSLTRDHEGIGVGLYIVKETVSLLRGRLYIKSQIGIGTNFTVKMPIVNDINDDANIFTIDMDEKVERAKIELSDIYV